MHIHTIFLNILYNGNNDVFPGTTAQCLIDGIDSLSEGAVYGRFFHFSPEREVDLRQWLTHWIEKGRHTHVDFPTFILGELWSLSSHAGLCLSLFILYGYDMTKLYDYDRMTMV